MSAFQSAGQRCSALRILYVQEAAYERLMKMLFGAMDALTIGDPWNQDTDVSPVIDTDARYGIDYYIDGHKKSGSLLKRMEVPAKGIYGSPAVVKVDGIADMEREIFGPVLHVATFKVSEIDNIVDDINARGYGLTFGVHTRIDDRVQQIVERIEVGNAYVNRNQIGAIVGSQPFGGEGLSGTGPKAGGPLYLTRFRRTDKPAEMSADLTDALADDTLKLETIQDALDSLDARHWAARPDRVAVLRKLYSGSGGLIRKALSATATFDMTPQTLTGPTGESNRLSMYPKGKVLCLGPTPEIAVVQAIQALGAGCAVAIIVPGVEELAEPLLDAALPVSVYDGSVSAESLQSLEGIAAVAAAGNSAWTASLRRALAERSGAIVPLETQVLAPSRYVVERHLCIDTTASGGNVSLLSTTD